jgi:phosphoribosylformylglycinamidine cyclo-ligase
MSLSYKEAGVDIEGGNEWVRTIGRIMSTLPRDPNVVGGIGGFSGLYKISDDLMLAGCCDGVGTKLEVAKLASDYSGLGQDLVAMNVNDLITCGAKPLFFLDYIACGRLDQDVLAPIVKSAAEACIESGCALLGGETAEMPGVYPETGFDLAGFSVGIVSASKLIDGRSIEKGDVLVGLPSSGIHSNGYSLVRKVLLEGERALPIDTFLPQLGESLSKALLRPTRLYSRIALKTIEKHQIHGMAHITGGGLEENIQRVLPSGLSLHVDFSAWERPAVFQVISEAGVEEKEMRHVFNLGIGYSFIVSPSDADGIVGFLTREGEKPVIFGEVY